MLDLDSNELAIKEEEVEAPIWEDDDEPFIGQTFESQEEAYAFYNDYAKQHGVVAVKDRIDTKCGTTVRQYFLCH